MSWPCPHFQGAGNSRQEAWGGAGEGRPKEGKGKVPKAAVKVLGQKTLSQNYKRSKAGPEKPGHGFYVLTCIQRIDPEGLLRSTLQRIGHDPLVAHETNFVSTH